MAAHGELWYGARMTNLFAARSQMALSLGFHIVFAAIGMAMPWLMAISHFRWLRTKDPVYLTLTKTWSKGVAIFFAVGAVSGTVLSFELGLLWPAFMKHAGPIIGMPFSWEGTAFFLEAIALGLFLYGWNRMHPWVHWVCGLVVGIAGVASALFVVCANAWMNSPAGFVWTGGHAEQIDPWRAMWNAASWSQGIHMILAAFVATGFAVAGLHALALLRGKRVALHQAAVRVALPLAAVAALLQGVSGDFSARSVAARQPAKFAAMEALFHTQQPAPFLVGGLPNEQTETITGGLHIPRLLGLLAHHDLNAKVTGLDAFPKDQRPPVLVVHVAFQLMIAIGSALALFALGALLLRWRKPHLWWHRRFLWCLVLAWPLGFVAIEAGWTVTEVGRQPWIIYGIMRTSAAVTPVPGLWFSLGGFAVLYGMLAVVVGWLVRRQFRHVD